MQLGAIFFNVGPVVLGGLLWIVGLFLMWRRMRLEVGEEEVFSLGYLVGLGMLAGWVVASRMRLGLEWWGITGGGLGAMAYFCRVKKQNFWEWLDVVTPIMYVGLGVAMAFRNWGALAIWIGGWVVIVGVLKHYRNFRWYKSGKPGLAGLTALFWLSCVFLLVAFWNKPAIYLGSLSLSQWLAVIAIAGILTVVYLRSGQKVAEELWLKIKTKLKKAKRV